MRLDLASHQAAKWNSAFRKLQHVAAANKWGLLPRPKRELTAEYLCTTMAERGSLRSRRDGGRLPPLPYLLRRRN